MNTIDNEKRWECVGIDKGCPWCLKAEKLKYGWIDRQLRKLIRKIKEKFK